MSGGKRAAAAVVLVSSALLAGPSSSAAALAPSAPGALAPSARSGLVAPTPGATASRDAELALGARLATEYAGAVPAGDVESLVRSVSHQLRRDAKLADRLPHAIEAVCRRALTDFLAVGVPLPLGEA
ncbi:MAG: hypothetical protein WCF36_11325 [Candidatus Nanopelagicales bacterium]